LRSTPRIAHQVDVHQENKNHLRKLDINQGCEMTPTLNFVTLQISLSQQIFTETN
jgi:hypothetical protein